MSERIAVRWRHPENTKMFLAEVECPACKKWASVSRKTHQTTGGYLMPSMICPFCPFHEFVRFGAEAPK